LGGKDGLCLGLQTLPHTGADCLEIWDPHLPGNLIAFADLNRDSLPFIFSSCIAFIYQLFVLTLIYNLSNINPLNPELNPICYLLALLGAHHFFSR